MMRVVIDTNVLVSGLPFFTLSSVIFDIPQILCVFDPAFNNL